MNTAIKLVLIYFGFQILGVVIGSFIGILFPALTTGSLEGMDVSTLSFSLFFGIVFMGLYLWVAGYISADKANWSYVSGLYMLLTVAVTFAVILILDFLMSFMDWLPDIMESTFTDLQGGWLGILCIVILGPILEELLFRGAITRKLLQEFKPKQAIIFSALIFGIVHINPIQVVSASIIGLLLAWIYYKTRSLIPCIVIHIINNSLSVYLSLHYPEAETKDLFPDQTYYIFLGVALVVLIMGLYLMNKVGKGGRVR